MAPPDQSRVSNAQGKAGARDCSGPTAEQIDKEVRKLFDDAYQLARTTLMADRGKLESIAKALLQYGSLGRLPNRRNHRARLPDKSAARRSAAVCQEDAGGKPAWFIGS